MESRDMIGFHRYNTHEVRGMSGRAGMMSGDE